METEWQPAIIAGSEQQKECPAAHRWTPGWAEAHKGMRIRVRRMAAEKIFDDCEFETHPDDREKLGPGDCLCEHQFYTD
jgi:hypothetical protein